MRLPFAGAIDCDVHVAVPGIGALVPYLDAYWRERVSVQQLERLDLSLTSYPPTAPLSGRPDWRPANGPPGSDLALLQAKALDAFGTRFAILNCLWGAQALFAEDMAAALSRAVNDWIAAEWLDRDPRLRASIMVRFAKPRARGRGDRAPRRRSALRPGAAARRARHAVGPAALLADLRGRRKSHDLPVGIHAGSDISPSAERIGWPSLSARGLRLQHASLRGAAREPRVRGRVREVPGA